MLNSLSVKRGEVQFSSSGDVRIVGQVSANGGIVGGNSGSIFIDSKGGASLRVNTSGAISANAPEGIPATLFLGTNSGAVVPVYFIASETAQIDTSLVVAASEGKVVQHGDHKTLVLKSLNSQGPYEARMTGVDTKIQIPLSDVTTPSLVFQAKSIVLQADNIEVDGTIIGSEGIRLESLHELKAGLHGSFLGTVSASGKGVDLSLNGEVIGSKIANVGKLESTEGLSIFRTSGALVFSGSAVAENDITVIGTVVGFNDVFQSKSGSITVTSGTNALLVGNLGVVKAENGSLSISSPAIEIEGSGSFSAKLINITGSGSLSKIAFTGLNSFKAEVGTSIDANNVSLGSGSEMTAKGEIIFSSNRFANDGKIVSNSKIQLHGRGIGASVDPQITGNGSLEAPIISISSHPKPPTGFPPRFSITQNEIKGTITGTTYEGLNLTVQTGGLQLGSIRNISSGDIRLEAKQHGIFLHQGSQLINQAPGSAISLIASDPATGSISLGKNSYIEASKVNVIVGTFPATPPVTDFDNVEINITGTTPLWSLPNYTDRQ